MPTPGLNLHKNLDRWWGTILELDQPTIFQNASALNHLYGCEIILGLKALPVIQAPVPANTKIKDKKPLFKNLEPADIQVLRSWLHLGEETSLINDWAETILRYSEINQSSLVKKARVQFQTVSDIRLPVLDMTAFLLDFYHERHDLRFLNVVLKLIELPGLINLHGIDRNLLRGAKKLSITLLQVRLYIMCEAALLQLRNEISS